MKVAATQGYHDVRQQHCSNHVAAAGDCRQHSSVGATTTTTTGHDAAHSMRSDGKNVYPSKRKRKKKKGCYVQASSK